MFLDIEQVSGRSRVNRQKIKKIHSHIVNITIKQFRWLIRTFRPGVKRARVLLTWPSHTKKVLASIILSIKKKVWFLGVKVYWNSECLCQMLWKTPSDYFNCINVTAQTPAKSCVQLSKYLYHLNVLNRQYCIQYGNQKMDFWIDKNRMHFWS